MPLGQPTRWEHCHDITAVGRGNLDIFKVHATNFACRLDKYPPYIINLATKNVIFFHHPLRKISWLFTLRKESLPIVGSSSPSHRGTLSPDGENPDGQRF